MPHGGEQVEETGGGDQGGEYPEGAPDPENGSERSGEQLPREAVSRSRKFERV
jgi:hypothetical protein